MVSRTWTDEQRELFSTLEGKLLVPQVAVSADAGSGKTSVLVERVKQILQSQSSINKKILCVSFTQKSAADLSERLSHFREVEVQTIHGYCNRLISEFGSVVGLPPVYRIADGQETFDLFYKSFERIYRKTPPKNFDHGVQTYFQLCNQARSLGEFTLKVGSPFKEHIEKFIREVLEDFTFTKQRLQIFEYNDLENFALQILKNPNVLEALQNRYAHVFVDEFQDTSQVQCDLVETLLGKKTPVFVVGDVKQSIYRFRGADVEVFQNFTQRLPAQKRLSKNFRSHPEVIEAVNAVCTLALKNYDSMVAARELSEKFTQDLPRVARLTAETDAQGVAAVVKKLQASGRLLSDIVLLLPRLKGRQRFFSELLELGISVNVGAAGGLLGDEGFDSLVNLWIWACEPWNQIRSAQVAVEFELKSREELRDFIQNPSLKDFLMPEENLKPNCYQVLLFLEKRFSLHERFGNLYDQFRTLVLQFQGDGLSPVAVARRFQKLLDYDQTQVSGFSLLPPPSNLSGALRAMTVHSSKGLEFPIVLLVDLDGRKTKGGAVFRERNTLWLLGRTEDGKLDKSNPELKEAIEREKEAELQENARLLYVAMTRARDALYIIDRPSNQKDDQKDENTKRNPGWAAWLKEGLEKCTSAQKLSIDLIEVSPSIPLAQGLQAKERHTRLSETSPEYFPSRSSVTHLSKEKTKLGPRKISLNTGTQAREIGQEVHEILEREAWKELSECAIKHRLDFSHFWQWLETDTGRLVFPGKNLGKVCRIETEFAFEQVSDKGTLAGRMDRLLVFSDQVWIVDYKILFQKRSADELLQEYAEQIKAYCESAKILTQKKISRGFLLDVTAASGQVWLEVRA